MNNHTSCIKMMATSPGANELKQQSCCPYLCGCPDQQCCAAAIPSASLPPSVVASVSGWRGRTLPLSACCLFAHTSELKMESLWHGNSSAAIDQSHKSHNASVPYPTIHHSEKNAHFCSELQLSNSTSEIYSTINHGTLHMVTYKDINYSVRRPPLKY